jgi:hypothetical protein
MGVDAAKALIQQPIVGSEYWKTLDTCVAANVDIACGIDS